MPRRALVPCRFPRCPALTAHGWCPEHGKVKQRQDQQQRGTAAARGYTARWARYSHWYRQQHPLCVTCEREGRTTRAQHVDHIRPVDGPSDPLFWDHTNHQSQCHTCHSRKTVLHDGGFGRQVTT